MTCRSQQASHATTLFEALTNSDLIRLAGKHGSAEAHAGIGPLKVRPISSHA